MLDRREFVGLAVRSAVPPGMQRFAKGILAERPTIKAIAFDAFPVFDPRPIFQLAEELFPGRGTELSNEWKTRQFEYTWLRTLTGRYEDFWQVTQDALAYSAAKLHLQIGEQETARLMNAYLGLKPWPDVVPVLRSLKDSGLRLGFLSNFTEKMLRSCMDGSGLTDLFEQVLTTDRARAFKPDARAYQLGVEAFKLRKEEIAFVAFAGWDAVGAQTFGYSTLWVNRLDAPAEQWGVQPNATGKDLHALTSFVSR